MSTTTASNMNIARHLITAFIVSHVVSIKQISLCTMLAMWLPFHDNNCTIIIAVVAAVVAVVVAGVVS